MVHPSTEQTSKDLVLTKEYHGTWRKSTQHWRLVSEIKKSQVSPRLISTSDHGDRCLGGTKKTWTYTQSITCTPDTQNSGTQWTSETTKNLRSMSKTSFKRTLKNAGNSSGTRTHSFILATWSTSASEWTRLHNTPGSSSSQGQLRITRDLTQGITWQRQLTLRRLPGSKWEKNVESVSVRLIAWRLIWSHSSRI